MAQRQPPYPKFPEQDDNGVDLSIIGANLRLSAWERYEKNYNGMKAMLEMRQMLKPLGSRSSSRDAAA